MLYILLTYLLTPWGRVLFEKLASLQLVKKFPAFYGTRRFLTARTSARHLSLSWASPIQSAYPNPTSWRSILILSSHLRLGLPSGLFPSGFPTRLIIIIIIIIIISKLTYLSSVRKILESTHILTPACPFALFRCVLTFLCSKLCTPRPDLRSSHLPIQWVSRAISPGEKRLGMKLSNISTSCKVMNA